MAGPGWKGDLPGDLKRIDAPPPWILIHPRVHKTQTCIDAAPARVPTS